MNKHGKAAIEYIRAGLAAIPLGRAGNEEAQNSKQASFAWDEFKYRRPTEQEAEEMFAQSRGTGLAIVGGAGSGNLEIIDVDVKNDPTGTIWDSYLELLEGTVPQVYANLVVAATKKKGIHLYYRCQTIEPNQQLAKGEDGRAIIETRGSNGYVAAVPTEGYSWLQGDHTTIPTISESDRLALLGIARSLTRWQEPKAPERPKSTTPPRGEYTGTSPFEDYNERGRGHALDLLIKHGWREVFTRGERVHLRRPGPTDSHTSGNFHTGLGVLYVFSTSVPEFNAGQGYSASSIFTILECHGDTKQAYDALLSLGFGSRPGTVRTQRVRVEARAGSTDETTELAQPGGLLDRKAIVSAAGNEVVITSPGPHATEETLEAIHLARATGKRVYVVESGHEVRGYRYELQAIFTRYGAMQEAQGGALTDRQRDTLLSDLVAVSTGLQSTDRDTYLNELLEHPAIQAMGITKGSLEEAAETKRKQASEDAKARKLATSINKAGQLHAGGDTDAAMELLEKTLDHIKGEHGGRDLSTLLEPTTESRVREEESHVPDSPHSGYTINGHELLLPAGAMTIYAGATNHGKTLMLINTALNVAMEHPEKTILFLTYEERANRILQYFLNAYMNLDLNSQEDSNRRLLGGYFKTGSTQYIAGHVRGEFDRKRAEFFAEYIETGRLLIKYVDMDSTELVGAMKYAQERTDLAAVFVDYFQLLRLPQGKYKGYNSRQEELKQICIELKDGAVSTGLPVVFGAQFNRDVTTLLRLHPTLISEAGDIERIVDTLVGIWNLSKKPTHQVPKKEQDEIDKRTKGREQGLYLEILKSRDLPTGAWEILDLNENTGRAMNRQKAW